ncbi:hypothetical protein BpHYR1_048328 [Brachionus plicatilis]|uniref:Uncharacterized protein n=1 Tax=Brachionus plicatilis TaxID=10195 RepID=A0A3M7PEV1_BRAPC|nr:hypothetical protein BpHYR1_048328 [Brachionus plicatilis]
MLGDNCEYDADSEVETDDETGSIFGSLTDDKEMSKSTDDSNSTSTMKIEYINNDTNNASSEETDPLPEDSVETRVENLCINETKKKSNQIKLYYKNFYSKTKFNSSLI